MKITIEYNYPEEDVLEIDFYRGKTLLHNIFYDINGLNNNELFELKKEAVAKFCTVFPEISAKDVMKGFSAVDEKMHNLYKETFDLRGGAREGSGRKKGIKIGKIKPETVVFYKRVSLEEKDFLEKALDKYRKEHN